MQYGRPLFRVWKSTHCQHGREKLIFTTYGLGFNISQQALVEGEQRSHSGLTSYPKAISKDFLHLYCFIRNDREWESIGGGKGKKGGLINVMVWNQTHAALCTCCSQSTHQELLRLQSFLATAGGGVYRPVFFFISKKSVCCHLHDTL